MPFVLPPLLPAVCLLPPPSPVPVCFVQKYGACGHLPIPFSRFAVLQSQYDLIEKHLEHYNLDTVAFFKHLLASTSLQYQKYKGSVPISAEFIREHFRGAEAGWRELKEAGLLHATSYSVQQHQCRR